jgi:hypothetical protein
VDTFLPFIMNIMATFVYLKSSQLPAIFLVSMIKLLKVFFSLQVDEMVVEHNGFSVKNVKIKLLINLF